MLKTIEINIVISIDKCSLIKFYLLRQAVLLKPQSYTCCMSFRLGDADAALDTMKVQETYKNKYHKIVELFTI